MATVLLPVSCRGRKENLTTYSFGCLGLGVVVLSVVVVCTLALSSSMSFVSGLRLRVEGRVMIGGAGECWAAER